MPTRRSRKIDTSKRANAHWIETEAWQVSPRVTLEPGDLCKVKGQRGDFRFRKHVINPRALDSGREGYEWVEVVRIGNHRKQVESYDPSLIMSKGGRAKDDKKRRKYAKAKKDKANAQRVATRKANQA